MSRSDGKEQLDVVERVVTMHPSIRRNGSLHPPLGVTVPGCMHSDRTIREIKFRFQMLAFEGKKEWSWRDG